MGLKDSEIEFCEDGAYCKGWNDALKFFGSDVNHIRELLQADKDGRCVVLPCKVGDTVYTISCEPQEDRHCQYRIEEHVVGGFDVSQNRETGQLVLSYPGEWGYEGLETFCGCDGKWYLTSADAEAALGGGGNG